MLKSNVVKIAVSLMVVVAAGLSSVGCKKPSSLIEKVVFNPSYDLSSARLSLIFKSNVQSPMAGGIDTDYGHFFINPFTQTQPFEIGFDLDMNIFYDQDYVGLEPTMYLPNGLPIGIPYPVVQVASPSPIHPKFDLFGYVDVGHQSWLGVAVMFSFLNDQYFPPDLTVQQVFMRDVNNVPRVLAHIFGPTLDQNGTLVRNGGIGLFANVKSLIKDWNNGYKNTEFLPEKSVKVIGKKAKKYAKPRTLKKLENKLIRGLNLK